MIGRLLLAYPMVLLLAACEEAAPETENVEEAGEATGEVIGGSISDDMLPLEELRSQSPPAKRSGSSEGGDNKADESGDASE